MLSYGDELMVDLHGSTWLKIIITDQHDNEILSMRSEPTEEFMETLENLYGRVVLNYQGGNMDGIKK